MLLRKSLLVIILFCTLVPTVNADWARAFVVYAGNTYEITNEKVDADNIGKIIGQVTSYSDKEGTYSGNFSNVYSVGTKYYMLKGIEPGEAIAVKTKDGYIRCNYVGKYDGKFMDAGKLIAFLFVAVLFIIRWYNIREKKRLKANGGK